MNKVQRKKIIPVSYRPSSEHYRVEPKYMCEVNLFSDRFVWWNRPQDDVSVTESKFVLCERK